jgi:REP element-mobilizing transposase RayT
MNELPQRKPTRLKGCDYSRNGAYFVTICAKDRAEIFSRIVPVGDGLARPDCPAHPAESDPPVCPAHPAYPIVELTDIGEQIMQMINYANQRYDNAFVDKFVIMPNHIHLILVINGCDETERVCETGRANGPVRASPYPTVGNIIGGLKSGVSRNIGFSPWQRFFHDHIIRDEADYSRIAEYIENNPRNWRDDCFYTNEGGKSDEQNSSNLLEPHGEHGGDGKSDRARIAGGRRRSGVVACERNGCIRH